MNTYERTCAPIPSTGECVQTQNESAVGKLRMSMDRLHETRGLLLSTMAEMCGPAVMPRDETRESPEGFMQELSQLQELSNCLYELAMKLKLTLFS